ncbi:S10 family serine carboxypeptidase-like protein [Sphingomonas adhaesiva]|uniref:S10 family serine carboxypeptidase-like protein n=1 Tax=Sphingomonas adhaesiva TaxID=28212 RepID=UPI002FFAA359
MTRRVALMMMTSLVAAAPVMAQNAPVAPAAMRAAPAERRAETHHAGTFAGQALRYTAVVEDNIVPAADGTPGASIVTTAYLREGVKDVRRRPVLFAFNGGPGAGSAMLNTKALGPMIRAEEPAGAAPTMAGASTAPLVANADSVLDAVDLVFVDPVGTGVSRALPGVDAKQYYNADADVRSVQQAIAHWLKVHRREASPRYVMGESYGTVRAGLLMRDRAALRFDGVMLVALVGRTPGPDLPFITALPTMAAGRWFHRPDTRDGKSVRQVYDEAVAFAQTDYASALIRGGSMAAGEREAMARRVAAMIGVDPALVLANALRVPKNVWMFNLLKDRGLRTGLLDVRVTAPLPADQEGDGALDDPALAVVPTGAKKDGKPFNPADVGPVPNPVFGAHLTHDLKFPTQDIYYAVNFSANAAWKHDPTIDAVRPVADAMRADPKLRLFWTAGVYDLTTPAYEARYGLDQAGIPAERLTAEIFDGPHGVYEGVANRAKFAAAVRGFVALR